MGGFRVSGYCRTTVSRAPYCRGLQENTSLSFFNCMLIIFYVTFVVEAKPIASIPEAAVVTSANSPLNGWNRVASTMAKAKFELRLPANFRQVNGRHLQHAVAVTQTSRVLASPPDHELLSTMNKPTYSSQLLKSLTWKDQRPASMLAVTPSSVGNDFLADLNKTSPSGLAQPPSSRETGCCEPNMVQKRGVRGCHCVYPVKVELFLQNVSLNSNWSSEFLQELAYQLGLRVSQFEIDNFYVVGALGLNITMDIAPHTGISFSVDQVFAMNSSLTLHKVQIDPALVGDYRLLNFTWFKPLAPSPAPTMAVSPVASQPARVILPKQNDDIGGENHSSLFLVIGICLGILIIIIIIVSIIYLSTSSKAKKVANKEADIKSAGKPMSEEAISREASLAHPTSTRFIAYEELKEATNNFEQSSMLGEGGFGRVFKGVLSDGTAVAIKKLTSGSHQGDKEFLVEVEMLSRLHHRNLVKLVGYYSSRESSQNLLCYELVPNGRLESWLHGHLGANCPLDWDTRMKIALDAARGLAYLHEDSQPCVIHRDFKASNILLENNFHAKVSDFGLAKQAPEGCANYLSTRVMGTFGYVAPEYAMTGHLLVKSEVYSYGVVLLELLTGRRPVDMSQPSGQENLVSWARPILRDKDRLEELADPSLGSKYPREDFMRVCTIAAACVAPEANQRPTMGEVVQSLKMVQRVTEYQESVPVSSARPNMRQSCAAYESDGTSSMFSSGPFSGLSLLDNDNISRTAVFSEDLHEGR